MTICTNLQVKISGIKRLQKQGFKGINHLKLAYYNFLLTCGQFHRPLHYLQSHISCSFLSAFLVAALQAFPLPPNVAAKKLDKPELLESIYLAHYSKRFPIDPRLPSLYLFNLLYFKKCQTFELRA